MRKLEILALTAIFAMLFGIVLHSGDVRAQQRTLKEQLVGAWTLVSNDNVAPNGARRQIFGSHPAGILILDASGQYAQIMADPDRPKFKGRTRLEGTPEENTAVVRATAAHFGTWSVNEADKSLTMHMVINIFPNDDGTDSKRSFTLTGDELKQVNPGPSSGGAAEVVFKRAK